jgi:RNase H-fold protein (predicted Holliday junction resolvase)
MQNPDGILSKEDQSRVIAMIVSQAKKWSLYVGYKTTIFGKNWKTRNDAEEEEQAEEFAEKVKKNFGQVTFEAIPTDEKTKRQMAIISIVNSLINRQL